MFGRKKARKQQEFTPADLARLTENNGKIYSRTGARRSAQELTSSQKWKRRALWLLIALLAILLIMYLISMLLTQWGDLVISVDGAAQNSGIVIGERSDLSDSTVQLGAPKVTDVTNTTYSWLPVDEFDKAEGSYNGKDYLAYTFFVGNNGEQPANYEGVLSISGASKSMDEAVRVMVYKNGEFEIYAKAKRASGEPEQDTIAFLDDEIIMKTGEAQIKPGQIDRYTIVSWVEGNDPECVDDIMGGYMRMGMLFGIVDEKE